MTTIRLETVRHFGIGTIPLDTKALKWRRCFCPINYCAVRDIACVLCRSTPRCCMQIIDVVIDAVRIHYPFFGTCNDTNNESSRVS